VYIFVVCEDLIKRLILTTIGFDRVNEAVKLRLRQQLTDLCLSELISLSKSLTWQTEVSCAKHCHAMSSRLTVLCWTLSTEVYPAPYPFTTVKSSRIRDMFDFPFCTGSPQQSHKCCQFGIGQSRRGQEPSTMSTFARVLLVLPALQHEF